MKVHTKFEVDVYNLFCSSCSTREEARGEMQYTGEDDSRGFHVYECPYCHSVSAEPHHWPKKEWNQK